MGLFKSRRKDSLDIPKIEFANAKLNLAIDVLGKKDGYHIIDMVAVPLKFHDTIEISRINTNSLTKGIYLYCDDESVDTDETNIAWQALNLLKSKASFQDVYSLSIFKRIPQQSGLGGGSSDAAAVINIFKNLIDKTTFKEIENELVPNIGCDVLFSLYNQPARVRGIGEQLDPIKVKSNYYVLLVMPKEGLSTKSVFDQYDICKDEVETHPNIEELIFGLENGDENLIEKNLINVLINPASKLNGEILNILKDLKSLGLNLSSMTGSGSCCFALSHDEKKLKYAKEHFEKKQLFTLITEFAL